MFFGLNNISFLSFFMYLLEIVNSGKIRQMFYSWLEIFFSNAKVELAGFYELCVKYFPHQFLS